MAWQLAISGHVVFKSNHGEVLRGRVVMETAHLVTNCGSEETFVQAETALSQVDTEVSVDKACREKYKARQERKRSGNAMLQNGYGWPRHGGSIRLCMVTTQGPH